MSWEIESGRPIYSQIVDKIKKRIITGQYSPGTKLPSVRELAAEANVNPNTMQRAFSELEQSGLIITQRTAGRSVTDDLSLISKSRDDLAQKLCCDFVSKMKELGYQEEEMKRFMETSN